MNSGMSFECEDEVSIMRTWLVTGSADRYLLCCKAPVAQLDRASDFESEGREFESLRARQLVLFAQ